MKALVDMATVCPLMSIIPSRRAKQTSTPASSMYLISSLAMGWGHSPERSRPDQARITPSTLAHQRWVFG